MAIEIKKIDVWAGEVEDRPGGLHAKLEALGQAGANLDFVIARRAPEKPNTSVVFLAPLKGTKQTKAAESVGLAKTDNLHSLRLEAPDKPGLGVKITGVLKDAGINLRGLSAAAVARRCVVYFAFDNADDAKKAAQLLKKSLAGK